MPEGAHSIMKAFLMYRDRDFDLEQALPSNQEELAQDLALGALFNAMALGDSFLVEVAKKAVLASVQDLDSIRYRQDILRDCLKNPAVIREIYNISVESIGNEKRNFWFFGSRYPSSILSRSIDVLNMFAENLRKIRDLAVERAGGFASEGLIGLVAMLKKELTDEFFADVQNHLKQLAFGDGVSISAELGKGNKGANYTLHKPPKNESWLKRIFAEVPPSHTFHLHPRDEAGFTDLAMLRDRGINLVANALAQSTDHIRSFFTMLRAELAFYVGCLNLHDQLSKAGAPLCFPELSPANDRRHSFNELYDVSLALTMNHKVVGNDVNADNRDLVIITGANQGGKSTFLRSIGLAQLMTQCGMFVPANSFCANICSRLFTHYKREEDLSMTSGKLDEELARMSEIVDELTPNAMVLFNESFAATNEREGSEIARQIIRALSEKRIKIFFVTHFYDLADRLWQQGKENVMFLRAERRADGERTFKLIVGEPLQTSYGEDLYNRIFESETTADADARPPHSASLT
jgi:DNA mismatch repair ATPase MutS